MTKLILAAILLGSWIATNPMGCHQCYSKDSYCYPENEPKIMITPPKSLSSASKQLLN